MKKFILIASLLVAPVSASACSIWDPTDDAFMYKQCVEREIRKASREARRAQTNAAEESRREQKKVERELEELRREVDRLKREIRQ